MKLAIGIIALASLHAPVTIATPVDIPSPFITIVCNDNYDPEVKPDPFLVVLKKGKNYHPAGSDDKLTVWEYDSKFVENFQEAMSKTSDEVTYNVDLRTTYRYYTITETYKKATKKRTKSSTLIIDRFTGKASRSYKSDVTDRSRIHDFTKYCENQNWTKF